MTAISRRYAISSLVAATAATAASIFALDSARADAPGPGGVPDKAPGAAPRASGLKAQLTPEDREMNRKCINKTLTEAPTGKTYSWKNPKTGNGGTVTPTSGEKREAGQQCRTFDETLTLKDGRTEKISGRACKKPDGSWNISA